MVKFDAFYGIPQYYYCVYRCMMMNSARFSQYAMPLRLIIVLLLVATLNIQWFIAKRFTK